MPASRVPLLPEAPSPDAPHLLPRGPSYLPMSGAGQWAAGHVQALGEAVGTQLGHPALEQVLGFDLQK